MSVLGEGPISSGSGCFKGQEGRTRLATQGWAAPSNFKSCTGLLLAINVNSNSERPLGTKSIDNYKIYLQRLRVTFIKWLEGCEAIRKHKVRGKPSRQREEYVQRSCSRGLANMKA